MGIDARRQHEGLSARSSPGSLWTSYDPSGRLSGANSLSPRASPDEHSSRQASAHNKTAGGSACAAPERIAPLLPLSVASKPSSWASVPAPAASRRRAAARTSHSTAGGNPDPERHQGPCTRRHQEACSCSCCRSWMCASALFVLLRAGGQLLPSVARAQRLLPDVWLQACGNGRSSAWRPLRLPNGGLPWRDADHGT
jgi:hypothetical protein